MMRILFFSESFFQKAFLKRHRKVCFGQQKKRCRKTDIWEKWLFPQQGNVIFCRILQRNVKNKCREDLCCIFYNTQRRSGECPLWKFHVHSHIFMSTDFLKLVFRFLNLQRRNWARLLCSGCNGWDAIKKRQPNPVINFHRGPWRESLFKCHRPKRNIFAGLCLPETVTENYCWTMLINKKHPWGDTMAPWRQTNSQPSRSYLQNMLYTD